MKTIEISDKAAENLELFEKLMILGSDGFISDILERVDLFTLFRMSMNLDKYKNVIGLDRKTFVIIRDLSIYFGKSIEEFVELCFDEQSPLSMMKR